MPQVSREEFKLLDQWGRKTHGDEQWDKLTKRQKCLFVTDFFYLHYKKQCVHQNGGERK